jgi:3-deoxy-D-manno-octulosonic-acid transferase
MVRDNLPATLRTYRLFSTTARILVPLLLAHRLRRGKELSPRIIERRGRSHFSRPAGQLIWLHAASVGELLSVLPLIERINARQINMLVTTGTVTSSNLASQRLPHGVVHQFVPLDLPIYVQRFLDHWQPDLVLLIESDLWPNIIIETSRRGVPIILVNGRLSEDSFQNWKRFRGTIANLLERFDLCLARTPTDAERLRKLGAHEVIMTGNLKLDARVLPADASKLKDLQVAITRRPVIAAASTHPGEEEMMIAAHQRLRADFQGLLTIIAPRHPERGPSIAHMVKSAGLNVAIRSRGDLPRRSSEVYVADTLGELGLIYRVVPMVFVGGSLVKHGGQNPIEPSQLGTAVLHGPHVWNFTEIYAALDAAHGAQLVSDSEQLITALKNFMQDQTLRARVAESGRTTVNALGGALERTFQSLEPYLMQLQLRQQAGHA